MVDYIAMGKRIRKLRLLKKKTQAHLAKECAVSTSFYGHIERGSRKASLETLLSISIALDATTDYLIKGKNRMPHGSADLLNKENMALRMVSVLIDHAADWMTEA